MRSGSPFVQGGSEAQSHDKVLCGARERSDRRGDLGGTARRFCVDRERRSRIGKSRRSRSVSMGCDAQLKPTPNFSEPSESTGSLEFAFWAVSSGSTLLRGVMGNKRLLVAGLLNDGS